MLTTLNNMFLAMKVAFFVVALMFLIETVHANPLQTAGLFSITSPACSQQTRKACPTEGFTLIRGVLQFGTYLIDNEGRIVNQWHGTPELDPNTTIDDNCVGTAALLTDHGNLIINCHQVGRPDVKTRSVPPLAGLLLEYDWDGNLIWAYDSRQGPGFDDSKFTRTANHDLTVLPNGNLLFSQIQGLPGGVNDKEIVELSHAHRSYKSGRPKRLIIATDADILWKWKLSEHSFKAVDDANARANPQLWDPGLSLEPSLINGIEYLREFDQIAFSITSYGEIYIIDHSTTMAQASGHEGGLSGRGGDFLYRWGNASNYGHTSEPAMFPGKLALHTARLLVKKRYGYKRIVRRKERNGMFVFTNGAMPVGPSSITEFKLPVDNGVYTAEESGVFGPLSFSLELNKISLNGETNRFFSFFQGNAQRLPGGNYLINEGTKGTIYEVDAVGHVVWKYVFPVVNNPFLVSDSESLVPDKVLGTTDPIPTGRIGPLTQTLLPFSANITFKVTRYSENYSGFDKVYITDELERKKLISY